MTDEIYYWAYHNLKEDKLVIVRGIIKGKTQKEVQYLISNDRETLHALSYKIEEIH